MSCTIWWPIPTSFETSTMRRIQKREWNWGDSWMGYWSAECSGLDSTPQPHAPRPMPHAVPARFSPHLGR